MAGTLASRMWFRMYTADRTCVSAVARWEQEINGAELARPSDWLLRKVSGSCAGSEWLRKHWYGPIQNVDGLVATLTLPDRLLIPNSILFVYLLQGGGMGRP